MVLLIQLFLIIAMVLGVLLLTWGARRFNLGQRSLTIALAMTTLSWLAFLVITITFLVSLYVNQLA